MTESYDHIRGTEEDHSTHEEYQSLVQDMYYQKAVNDRKEVDSGERFYDTGTRIPGRQKAKNDTYTKSLSR